ncbi:hypothetical protein ACWDLG_12945 [Nonomuraea sp. NPDC003727]
MNNEPNPSASHTTADRPRRSWSGALLTAALPVTAAVALNVTPPATVLPGPELSGAPRPAAVVAGEECVSTLMAGALNTVKWPDCAGD